MRAAQRRNGTYEIVLVGVSAGGFDAVPRLLRSLPVTFSLPVVIVQHESQDAGNAFARYLDKQSSLPVRQADEKEAVMPGTVYIAPPGYHLLVEEDRTFALCADDPVNYARPSIDVLFEVGAEVYGTGAIGIILTGANSDGAQGLKRIKDAGGLALVQDPSTAEVDSMPKAALAATEVDAVLSLEDMGPYLTTVAQG